MRFLDIISKKRDGYKLTEEELDFFIRSVSDKNVPDYQISSFLMAVFFRGMDFEETAYLTKIMAESGLICELGFLNKPTVDKHSTGGVGDKISIVLAPLMASFDVAIPMMSGRGLGHTGGTLDKLESIPGFDVFADTQRYYELLKLNNFAMIGQTENIAPADKYLYALRDATGTVESIPLITSSIMSKKIAEGTKNLVIDLKVGKGAFMKTLENAKKLGRFLIETGKLNNVRTMCLLTDMNEPLGFTVGNSLEIMECADIMKGDFSAADIVDLTCELSAHMLRLSKDIPVNEGREMCRENLKNGKALDYFRKCVLDQKGDAGVIDDYKKFKQPQHSLTLAAKDFFRANDEYREQEKAYIASIDAYHIGLLSTALGAGRNRKEDVIDPSAGIYFHKKKGDVLIPDDKVVTLYSDSRKALDSVAKDITGVFAFSPVKPEEHTIVIDQIH